MRLRVIFFVVCFIHCPTGMPYCLPAHGNKPKKALPPDLEAALQLVEKRFSNPIFRKPAAQKPCAPASLRCFVAKALTELLSANAFPAGIA
ncbi:hypothetical protein EEX84_01335 [Planococcus salinus]|uniref:Uncharacterized protein n=1 Tax=Planococcus salinus TaxID=1848460 RepID=A0A3M8PDJ5_9BACL|nr:hypothetical protein EEX84_01335 [Planococcus salinus]